MSELRWNPVLSQWVIIATHRQDRTFLPPKDHCPLCPTTPGSFPTEVPADDYEIVCFENRFPSLKRNPPEPAVKSDELFKVKPSKGICEVILYTPVHEGTLTDRSVDEIYRLILVWTDRFKELGDRKEIKYVFIFENKGEVIGVTLPHPHGQIYGFPYIPPVPKKELESARKYYKKNNTCLFCKILEKERYDGRRKIWENNSFYAGIPFYARYPYEAHITSLRHLTALTEMTDDEHQDLACILKALIVKYDRLWNFSFPYMMVMHQRPTDRKNYPYYHFHIEFYPTYRAPEKLKYLAGCESGAGTFINDTLPEEKARELRNVDISDIERDLK
ncbi:MAG: galactose-1-phosphate uridylyltransferase [Candidatus Eremiobacteraeota bacterium]|nr:galactose-1-phosphate uridylyltransferase [Candidatus Eremiobacteraeota bacterium]